MTKWYTPIKERLLDKVYFEPNTGCWLWGGAIIGGDRGGYGKIAIEDQQVLAHRLSYETFVEPIPKDLCVLHKCDVRPCINPDHLYTGTHKNNSQDREKRGRGNHGVALAAMQKANRQNYIAQRRT